jgi:hypothetical protein
VTTETVRLPQKSVIAGLTWQAQRKDQIMDSNNLTYEEFVEKMQSGLQQIFGKKYKAEFRCMQKSDDNTVDVISVMTDMSEKPGGVSLAGPVVYPKESFERYKNGETFGQIMYSVTSQVEKSFNKNQISEQSKVMNDIENYDAIKSKLFIRAISYTQNNIALKECYYKKVHDIALTLYVLALDKAEKKERSLYSAKIFSKLSEKWEIGLEDAYIAALKNTAVLFPPRLAPQEKAFTDTKFMEDTRYDFMNPLLQFKLERSMMNTYMLTNSIGTNGATAAFYPGVARRVYNILGEPYYLVPLSINEMMVHPMSSISAKAVKDLASGPNSYVDERMFLSRSAYCYNQKSEIVEALR